MKKKHFNISLAVVIALFVIALALLAVGYWYNYKRNEITLRTPFGLIGGQKDEHGCLIAAGYSWCQPKLKCMRLWEESCDLNPDDIVPINKTTDSAPRVIPRVN